MLNQRSLIAMAVGGAGYIVKYIAYNFLTPVVLMAFAAIVFVYINVAGPELPYFQYYSFLLPIDAQGNARLDQNDILRLFNILTAIFFLVSLLGGGLIRLLKRILRPEVESVKPAVPMIQSLLSSLKWRFLINNGVITLIFVAAFLAVPLARLAEGQKPMGMYVIMGVFYGIALVSETIFIGIDSLSNKVIEWALANR